MAKIKVVHKSKQKSPQKKLNFRKITPQIVAQALVILAVFGVIIFSLPNLPQMPTTGANVSYQGVINLWIVDSFEGGSGSRQSWFTKRASKFEQQNKGLFVCVTVLTEGQLESKLQQGQNFDMLCFSRGIGEKVIDTLAPLDVDFGCVCENFAQSGRLNGTAYALPIFAGAYCLFARQSQQKQDVLSHCLTTTFTRKIGKNTIQLAPMVCGFAPYNSPLTALAMSGGKGSFTPDYAKSQYLAYEQFVENKTAVTLLGTQRDMYRLQKHLQMGKMEELVFAPLMAYTDLVGYLAVGRHSQNLQACTRFVEYLLSDQVQQTVAEMGMFSVTNQNLYSNGWYALCEQGLKDAYVPNLFADQDAISNGRQVALQTLQGNISQQNNSNLPTAMWSHQGQPCYEKQCKLCWRFFCEDWVN